MRIDNYTPTVSPDTATRQRRRLAVGAAAMASLALCLGVSSYHPELYPGGDNAEYWILSESLWQGKGFRHTSDPEAPFASKRLPGYPVVLTGCIAVFGNQLWALKLPSLLCFAGASALAFVLIARRSALSFGQAIAATLLFTCNSESLSNSTVVMAEMLFTMLGLGVILLADRLAQSERIASWAMLALGGLIAACVYVRPNGIVLVPAVGAMLVARRRWWPALAVIGTALVGVAPWGWVQARAVSQGDKTYFDHALPVSKGEAPSWRSFASAFAQQARHNARRRVRGLGTLVLARPPVLRLRTPEPAHLPAGSDTAGMPDQAVAPPTKWDVSRVASGVKCYGLALLVALGCVVTWRRHASAAHWYTLCTTLMLLAVTYQTDRYWYPLLPVFGWFLTEGVVWLATSLDRRSPSGVSARLATAGVWVLASASTVFTLAGAAHSWYARAQNRGREWSAPARYEYWGPDIVNYVRAGHWVRDHTRGDAVIVCRKPFILNRIAERRARCELWYADPDVLWYRVKALQPYGPVYIVQDGFGERYDDKDLSQLNLVPAIRKHNSEVTEVLQLEKPRTVVWRLAAANRETTGADASQQ